MGNELVLPLTFVGVCTLLALLLLGVFVLRRFVMAHVAGTFDCSLRGMSPDDSGSWMVGVARYQSDRLDWFRVFTVSPRPARSLARSRLEIIERRVPQGPEARTAIPGCVVVRCEYDGVGLELAMTDPAYNALAAWLESAPPGEQQPIA
ncbi:MAG: hypothetical protein QG608_2035 [Actinomycetota bacterium]|nr:hypothetical protein [Actinomycetota bacterium]